MSGVTPLPIVHFRALLRMRGSSLGRLADEIGTTRSYLSRVLHGDIVSVDTRKRLHSLTTPDEWATICQMENFATWNNAQSAIDAARPWVMREECGWCHGHRRFVPCCRAQAREVSHGLCPDCLRSHFPDFAEEVMAKQHKEAHAA